MQTHLDILLVEDNEGDVEMTRRALRDAPSCHLSVVHDGMEALDFLFKRGNFPDAPAPGLILLDLNLPRMDGKTFLEVVKAHENTRAIPVVMLTSSKSPADIKECYERYASCYVVKPFDSVDFLDAVKQVVHFWNDLGQLPGKV